MKKSYTRDIQFSPDVCHEKLLASIVPSLAFANHGQEKDYKLHLKEKLAELLGDMPDLVPLQTQILFEKEEKEFKLIRLKFCVEADTWVPAYLTVPHGVAKPPVIITLQGHSSGMHLSIGVAKSFKDRFKIKSGDRDFAVIAAQNGYAALVLEQRAFGERLSRTATEHSDRCIFPTMNALLLGRTMIGERVWDVMRGIDLCESLTQYVDGSKIACMGNSGGGTVTYYAAAMDERISIAMPSCSVCTYASSIGNRKHCVCNYIPRAAKFFDMGDLGALISPRKLVVVAGKKDVVFPFEGVERAFGTIKSAYIADNAGENCELFVGNGGHRFYRAAFEIFNKFAKELNWR